MTEHPFPPVWDKKSKILVLGSFPSVKSREQNFFYGHPQNRFWKVTSSVTQKPLPVSIEEKIKFLLSEGIALWDVISRCDIEGSADSTIRNVRVNDLMPILTEAHIAQIFVNGRTAEKYYNRYTLQQTGRTAVCLPSTSPANAAWSLPRLIDEWSVINTYLKNDE